MTFTTQMPDRSEAPARTKTSAKTKTPGDYAVGYGKPPLHTRFVKGRSGNPKGSSKAQALRRAQEVMLAEAYRTVIVKEDGRPADPMSALQAIVRSQIALALKGHAPSQRAVLVAVMAIEEERAIEAEKAAARQLTGEGGEGAAMSVKEAAQRIRFLLNLDESGEGQPAAAQAAAPDAVRAPTTKPFAEDEPPAQDMFLAEDGPGARPALPSHCTEASEPPESRFSLPNSLPAGKARATPMPAGRMSGASTIGHGASQARAATSGAAWATHAIPDIVPAPCRDDGRAADGPPPGYGTYGTAMAEESGPPVSRFSLPNYLPAGNARLARAQRGAPAPFARPVGSGGG